MSAWPDTPAPQRPRTSSRVANALLALAAVGLTLLASEMGALFRGLRALRVEAPPLRLPAP